MESVDEEILHAVGVVDATLELMPRIPIGDTDNHRPLPAVRRRQRAGGTRVRRRRGGAVAALRWSGDASGIGNWGYCVAYGAADRLGPRRQLENRPAAGAVHQHHHSGNVAVIGAGEKKR